MIKSTSTMLFFVFTHCFVGQSTGQEVPTTTGNDISISSAQLTLINDVKVFATESGIVENIPVTEGSQIQAGDVVALLESGIAQSELAVAKNELLIAELEATDDIELKYSIVSAEVNQKVLARSKEADAQFAKSISETELERLDLEYQKSVLGKQQAERKMKSNQITRALKEESYLIALRRLEDRVINSPLDGMVVEKFVQKGEWVQTGQPVARVINLDKLRVKCLVSQKTVRPDQLALNASFELSIGESKINVPAKVVFVSPEIDPIEQDYAVWAEVDNSSRKLSPGLVGQLLLRTKNSDR